MATKTITIMDDAYKMLASQKREEESFSDTIRRLSTKETKRDLKDFFGIISAERGTRMLKDLERNRKEQIKLARERYR